MQNKNNNLERSIIRMKNNMKKQASSGSVFRQELVMGFRDGIPIGLGYFAVAFSLGIAARSAGLTAVQGFIASLLTNASAGEYAVFSLIGANAAYLEVAMITVITNIRYLLMSCALSQKLSPDTPLSQRFLVGFCITDEIFGISIARPGYLCPWYSFGALLIASPCWALGTACGIVTGNMLPVRVVSALSVALFGMFLAVIIPPSRKSKVVAGLVLISFLLSWAFSVMPYVSSLSEGTRTILLTVVISGAAAVLFPVKNNAGDGADTAGDTYPEQKGENA